MAGMNGQWVGYYKGSSSGMLILNVDERGSGYQGTASLIEDDKSIPSAMVYFRTHNKETRFSFRTTGITAVDSSTGLFVDWESIKAKYPPGTGFSQYADIQGMWDSEHLVLNWKTDKGYEGEARLPRSQADRISNLNARAMTWDDFKNHVATISPGECIFRGQEKGWRLRTSFHRRGRADLVRYVNEDIKMLHRHLSSRTRHIFDLERPDQNGAFFNLIQHHGYPTPLLDWTHSPYVAAFFAYRSLHAPDSTDNMVRIHVFHHRKWTDWVIQRLQVVTADLNLSLCEFIAIENERMVPQQSISMISNIDDIESFLIPAENNGPPLLEAIDLPYADRSTVMRDLSRMGITAGSMFPGLDGACEELLERNFNTYL